MEYENLLKASDRIFKGLERVGLVKVIGCENVPDDDELNVFYGDHKGYLDPVLTIMALQRYSVDDGKIMAPMYPAYLGWQPSYKRFPKAITKLGKNLEPIFHELGAFPIFNVDYHTNLREESFEYMKRQFLENRRMIIFPEGRIQREGMHQPYKHGIASLDKALEPNMVYFIPFEIDYGLQTEIEFGERFDVVFDMDILEKLDTIEDAVFDLKNKRDSR